MLALLLALSSPERVIIILIENFFFKRRLVSGFNPGFGVSVVIGVLSQSVPKKHVVFEKMAI